MAPSGSADGFRRGEQGLEWNCPTCGHWSSIEAEQCEVCQTPFSARIAYDEHATETSGVDGRAATRVAWLNIVLPGLGHIVAGWTGSGLARLVLYSVWVVGGLAIFGAGGTLVAIPLLIGAAIIWGSSLHDAWQLGQRGPQLLNGRALLWLVIGVTLLSMLGVGAVALSAAAG